MSRQELRTVTRAAIGIATGLAAFASAAAAAETGDTLFRTAWFAAGGPVAQIRDILLLSLSDPAALQVAGLAAAAAILGLLSIRSFREVSRVSRVARPERTTSITARRRNGGELG